MNQLTLLEWDTITDTERHELHTLMRNHYWHIRNLRKGKFGQARLRFEYRKVAILKRRLLLAGVEKREVLDIIACCRLSCRAKKQPFLYCKHCNQGRG